MNNYVLHYRKTEVQKRMLLLLLLAAFGTFLDGITTMAGQSVGLEEYSPVVNAIGGLGVSLLLRAVVVIGLYLIIVRLRKRSDARRVSIALLVYAGLVWLVAFLNAGATTLVYLFY